LLGEEMVGGMSQPLESSNNTINLAHQSLGAAELQNLVVSVGCLDTQQIFTIKLGFNNLRDEGAKVVASVLMKNSSITSLDLGFCSISDEGVAALSKSLIQNSTLKILYLSATTKMDRTLLIVKPDGVQRNLVGEILSRWEKRGFKLVAMKLVVPSKDLAEQHYGEHKGKPFYDKLVSFITSGPAVFIVFEGKGVVETSRKMIGATNPLNSEPGTVRGDLAVDMGRNVIHGSDSKDSAAREIKLWFGDNEVFSWASHSQADLYE
jgi:nucleoside-diphosphate kinase